MAASWLVTAFQADLTVCCKTPRRRKRPLEEGVRNGGFWVNLGAGIRSGSTMTATRRLTAILAADVAGWSSARQSPEALLLMEQAIERDPHYGPALAWAA